MKHFISTVSTNFNRNMQKEIFQNLSENDILEHTNGITLRNAILVPVSNAVKKEEQIKLTLMLTVKSSGEAFADENGQSHPEWLVDEDTQLNFNDFIAELNELRDVIGFRYELNILPVPHNELPETHFELFRNLVRILEPKQTEEAEKLYVDMTFGMKPMPMILFMVLNYLYRFSNNALPEALIYNQYDSVTKEKKLFELSHLFHMNAAFENMAHLDIEDPIGFMEGLVSPLEEDE